MKDSLQNYIVTHYDESERKNFPRGADLLIFFYELSFRLLNQNGINIFITENAWLSTDYGKSFQDYLLNNIKIQGIIDSDYKYFENADINTVITCFRLNKSHQTYYVPFFRCHNNLSVHPCNTLNINNNDKYIASKIYKSDNILLSKYKWSFISSVDKKLLDLLSMMIQKKDKLLSSKIEIGQGLNITKDNIKTKKSRNSVPLFVSDIGAIYRWAETKFYIDKTFLTSTRRLPLLFLPRGIGTHFCAFNELQGYSYSYVEIYAKEKILEEDKLRIWIFCNSSLLWLLREFTGRTNLGGGMLKAEATDLKTLPLCFDFQDIKEIKSIFETAKDQIISTKLEDVLKSPIHQRIDSIVFDYFNLPNKNFIIDLLKEKMNRRMRKSKLAKVS